MARTSQITDKNPTFVFEYSPKAGKTAGKLFVMHCAHSLSNESTGRGQSKALLLKPRSDLLDDTKNSITATHVTLI